MMWSVSLRAFPVHDFAIPVSCFPVWGQDMRYSWMSLRLRPSEMWLNLLCIFLSGQVSGWVLKDTV